MPTRQFIKMDLLIPDSPLVSLDSTFKFQFEIARRFLIWNSSRIEEVCRSSRLVQVNDAALMIRLVIFGSKVRYSSFIHRLQNRLEGGGERGEGCHPSHLLYWLTVICSGALTNSLGELPTISWSAWEWCGSAILPMSLWWHKQQCRWDLA